MATLYFCPSQQPWKGVSCLRSPIKFHGWIGTGTQVFPFNLNGSPMPHRLSLCPYVIPIFISTFLAWESPKCSTSSYLLVFCPGTVQTEPYLASAKGPYHVPSNLPAGTQGTMCSASWISCVFFPLIPFAPKNNRMRTRKAATKPASSLKQITERNVSAFLKRSKVSWRQLWCWT